MGKYERRIAELEEDNKRLQDQFDTGQSELERLLAGKDKEVSELAARCSSQCDELDKCKLLLEEAQRETQRLEKESHNRKDLMRRRICALWDVREGNFLRNVVLAWRGIVVTSKDVKASIEQERERLESEFATKLEEKDLRISELEREATDRETSLKRQMEDLERRLASTTLAQMEKSNILKKTQAELEQLRKKHEEDLEKLAKAE